MVRATIEIRVRLKASGLSKSKHHTGFSVDLYLEQYFLETLLRRDFPVAYPSSSASQWIGSSNTTGSRYFRRWPLQSRTLGYHIYLLSAMQLVFRSQASVAAPSCCKSGVCDTHEQTIPPLPCRNMMVEWFASEVKRHRRSSRVRQQRRWGVQRSPSQGHTSPQKNF